MDPLSLAATWYGIGALTIIVAMYLSDVDIKLGDVIGGIFLAFLGPVVTIIAVVIFLEDKSDTVIFKRDRR